VLWTGIIPTGGLDAMKEAVFLFAWMAWTICCNGGSYAGAELRVPELVIMGESEHVAARHLEAVYPEIKRDIENVLGWNLLSQPKLLLIADREVFQQMSGSPFISAFAVPPNISWSFFFHRKRPSHIFCTKPSNMNCATFSCTITYSKHSFPNGWTKESVSG
jgi:hypothetical protein